MKVENKNPVFIARGRRLRAVRDALKLSRQKFQHLYGIPMGTLQTWEEGRFNGLREKSAERVVRVLKKDEVVLSVEWLMFGTGDWPKLPGNKKIDIKSLQPQSTFSETLLIQRELAYFHELNSNCVDFMVADESMAPFLSTGDLVAGPRLMGDDIQNATGKICIVQIPQQDQKVRLLQPSHEPGKFALNTLNFESDNTDAMPVEIFSAAPVIWIRRKNPLIN